MKDSELVARVRSEIDTTRFTSDLQKEREEAIEYYYGEPFGNEVEGNSQVVSTDVQETIEWIMPSLMRIFTATSNVVCFDPVDPTDEEAAKQETDIVNHVFNKENNGFLVLYSMFKDALLVKNGIVKYWWDDSKEQVREEYQGLSDVELTQLLDNPNVEPIEHDETVVLTPQGPMTSHDIVIIRTNKTGRVMVEPVPPEEFLISRDAVSPDPSKASFVCHRTYKTRSELIQMGMKKSFVRNLPTQARGVDEDEAIARDYLNESENAPHRENEYILYEECYMKIDYNGDGVDELREVCLAGGQLCQYKDGSKGNYEVDAIPFAAITPIIITHKFHGLSVADTVMDLQLIKSTILRSILDNTYQTNNSRTAIMDGEVNMDDLLVNRSGGVVRTEQRPQDVVMPMPVAPLPPQTFQVWQTLEEIRKGRTGVGQDTMGLESNVLAHGKAGVVDQSFDMARMRIELIARVFAETGIKQLFLGIHRLLQQNQDKQKWYRIRNKWVPVNPSEWKERGNMTVTVGLGTGNKDRQVSGLMQILSIQKELIMNGGRSVNEQNIHNTLTKLSEALGYKNAEEFFTDPSTLPPPQPKPDPNEMLVQAQIQLAQEQARTTRMEAETNRQEAVWRHEEKMKELLDKDLRERTDMELKYRNNVPGALV